MTEPTIGPLFGAADLAAAAEATLRRWLPSTLHELERQAGLELVEPVDYRQVPTADAILAVEAVTLGVSVPGLLGEPRRSGRGRYSATWQLVVTSFVRGPDYLATAQLTSAYAVAIRTALLQHPDLGGVASSLDWRGEDTAPVGDPRNARTLQLAALEFAVVVDGVTDARAGWTTPPREPAAPELPHEHEADPALERVHVRTRPRTVTEE